MAKQCPELGPYSKAFRYGSVAGFDGRTGPGRFIRDCERQLLAHLGHPPSIPEKMLIQRLCRIALQLHLFDLKFIEGTMTDLDQRNYLAWVNTFIRGLHALGLRKADAVEPDIQDLIQQALAGQPEPEPEEPSRKRVRL